MRNAIILGSGRSGTSMVTGALTRAGYFQGDAHHAARASNPKGFFESAEINAINEALLAPMLDADVGEGRRWLAVPRAGAQPSTTPDLAARIGSATGRVPFCFKDPRFSFTLPAWRGALPKDTGFVCVFRHPALTATSLVREVQSAEYLAGTAFDLERAFELWTATYREILGRESSEGDWLFVHYDQMLHADGRGRLADFLGAPVDGAFPDPCLRREPPAVDVPAEAMALYAELCKRAGVAPERSSTSEAALKPRATVLAWLGPDDAEHVPALCADVADQRGVDAELVLLDATDGELDRERVPSGVRVEDGSWSRCADLARAATACGSDYVALATPGARWLPAHLAHAVARLDASGADVASCDLLLTDDQGRFQSRIGPASMGDVPGPFFEAGLVFRRAAAAELNPAAFFPGELSLWRALRADRRAAHEFEPGVTVDRRAYDAAWDRAQLDAALVTAREERGASTAPELSVSLCTYNRRATLRECLAAFARQTAAPGAFELVLTDDGSTDGTEACLDGLALAVPFTVLRRPNGGLAAARNTGLARARGRYVLFVNDDTIPAPDLVERHLAAHAALGREACVLGTFEQSREALGGALLRHLEGSTEVFGYSELASGGVFDAFRFWTCNVSAPLAAVRRVGAFDESFRHYGCEDTDLGFRMGLDVVYDASARAEHRHVMDFDYLRRRARTVARAYVRFFVKHPGALRAWSQESLTLADCERDLHIQRERLRYREDALRELSRIDAGALIELDGEYAAVANEVLEKIAELLPDANRLWWRAGYVDGLREHGLAGFDELASDGGTPWPIASTTGRVLFAHPRWDDPASLDALLERAAPIAADGFATLLLRRDPHADPSAEAALEALQAAWARAYGEGGDLEVLIDDAPMAAAELRRVSRSIDAFLPLGGEPAELLDVCGAEALATQDSVRAWRARFEGLPAPDVAPARETGAATGPSGVPELSVVVPTHDRARELVQLVDSLAAQDLEPSRFEVIVVDDGSAAPVEPLLARRAVPFALRVERQELAGPGAARNRGVALARAELVVFFNDDAVPARDCLRRHLAAHATTREPRAVLGTFALLPSHRVDSFALTVEHTNVLFAQPRMTPGVRYHGLSLCTGNVSLRREHLVAVGGFDETLPYAGGEDSELGLRLERELGLRVAFDPRVVAGHDHALDVRGFAARRRVVGWGAHRIQNKRVDAGLFRVASWGALEREVAAERSELDTLVQQVAEVCARERAGELRLGTTPGVIEAVQRIGELAFRAGLCCAHRGELPEPTSVPAAAGVPGLVLEEPAEVLGADEPETIDVDVEAPAAALPVRLESDARSARRPAEMAMAGAGSEPRREAAGLGRSEPARPKSNATGGGAISTGAGATSTGAGATATGGGAGLGRGGAPTGPRASGFDAPAESPSAGPKRSAPLRLPVAGPGATAATGFTSVGRRTALRPVRGLRAIPESLRRDDR